MRTLLLILGIIGGAAIACFLNLFLPRKAENKAQRIGLQIASYIVFILLGLAFTSIFSLRIVLDKFIVNRIQAMEADLSRMLPDVNIMEASFDISELVSMNNQIQQSINDIDTSNDSFFERLVYNAFIGKLSSYINAVDSGVTSLAMISDDNGHVTIKTVLYNLKDRALNTISPYFVVGQILILIVLFIFIGIYVGIIISIRKGSSSYNKSIVYGDTNNQ